MLKQVNNKILIYILIFILLVLASAFVIDFGLGHKACKLCLYQRIPYVVSILLIAKILLVGGHEKTILFILTITFIISSVLAFYHFGIEQDFFKESLSCASGNLENNLSKEELLKKLKQNNISCKNTSFKIFGFSLAALNTIISICLSIIFIKLFIRSEKNLIN